MIGIVIVAHARLAQEFLNALEHVLGPQSNVIALSMGAEDDIEKSRTLLVDAAKKVDTGKGIVILTDMFGGTPSNLALSLLETGKVEVIAGLNMPLLVKLASVRGTLSLTEAAKEAQIAGISYINIASSILGTS